MCVRVRAFARSGASKLKESQKVPFPECLRSSLQTSPPRPRRCQGPFQARPANAVSRHRRVPPFASSRRPPTHTLGHSQWPKPPRFVHATAPARWRLESHRPRAIRPLGRYGGACAIRGSPFDVGACHRVVRRYTCCSPAIRRSMRATQARAASGVHVGQPAPKAASKLSHEARRSSEECVGSHESHRPKYDPSRFVMV